MGTVSIRTARKGHGTRGGRAPRLRVAPTSLATGAACCRAGLLPAWSATDLLATLWRPPPYWYGASPPWRDRVESSARRVHRNRLHVSVRRGRIEYRIALDIRGPNDLVEVLVVFYAEPPYSTYGLHPQDYPRVWAERGLPSKHRMPDDDALCLYYPKDPVERRWTADKGLLDLLDLIVDHLNYETYWRASGGHNGGEWLGDEVEHGFPQVGTS